MARSDIFLNWYKKICLVLLFFHLGVVAVMGNTVQFSWNRATPMPSPYMNSVKSVIASDANLYGMSLLNNFLFWIPPLVWNIAFASSLPMDHFAGDAPPAILVAENIARVALVAYPLAIPINTRHPLFKAGAITYGVGIAIYFASWAYQTLYPETPVSNHSLMQFAPVYTPIIWLAGLSMMSGSRIILPALSVVFVGLHLAEYIIRYSG